MKLQQNIAFEMAEAKTGQCLDVIIEGELTSDNVYVARTMADAPKDRRMRLYSYYRKIYVGRYCTRGDYRSFGLRPFGSTCIINVI